MALQPRFMVTEEDSVLEGYYPAKYARLAMFKHVR